MTYCLYTSSSRNSRVITTTALVTATASALGSIAVATAFGGPSQSRIHPSTRIFDNDMNMEPPIVPVTPCTRICRYNMNVFDGQVCIGCFREPYEIGNWQRMSPTEKYYALLDASERLEAASSIIDQSETGTSREELLRQAEYWKSQAS